MNSLTYYIACTIKWFRDPKGTTTVLKGLDNCSRQRIRLPKPKNLMGKGVLPSKSLVTLSKKDFSISAKCPDEVSSLKKTFCPYKFEFFCDFLLTFWIFLKRPLLSCG